MVKGIFFCLIIILSAVFAYSDEPYIEVQFAPLVTEISTSTVTTNSVSGGSEDTTWTTCPSVAMRGRRGLIITNMHSSEEVYISRATNLTTAYWWPIFAKQSVWIRAGSDMDIFASSNTVINLRVLEIK